MDIPLPNITAAAAPGLSRNGTTPFAPDRHPIQPRFQFLSAGVVRAEDAAPIQS
jgi:hypothetical protein